MKQIINIIFVFWVTHTVAQSNLVDYTIIGNENNEYSTDVDTLDGFIYVTGNTNECQLNDGFVFKYKNNNVFARKIIGTESIDILETIKTFSTDSIMVAGYNNINGDYDIYVAKLDTQLNTIQQRTIAINNWNFCHDITNNGNGYFIGVGETHNNNDYDALIFKLSTNLDTLWTLAPNIANDQKLTKVIPYNDSIFIACGYSVVDGAEKDILLISINANTGDTLWTNTYGGINNDFCNSIIKTLDGGIAGFGTTSSYNSTSEDTYLFKTDSAGMFLWSNLHQVQTANNLYSDRGIDLVELSNGDFLVTNMTKSFGSVNVKSLMIMQTNSLGNWVNGLTYDGGEDDYPTSMVKINDTNIVIIGNNNSQSSGYQDIFLLNFKSFNNANFNVTNLVLPPTCFTKINDKENIKISLYPNPIKDLFCIKSHKKELLEIEILNAEGKKCLKKKIYTNTNIIFPKELDYGFYMIRILNSDLPQTFKVIYVK